MYEEDIEIANQAIQHIKSHKRELLKHFADLAVYPSVLKPLTVFMAGSPGAGKTEFSKRFIEGFEKKFPVKIVRIDPDDIRETLPGYRGNNSYVIQGACALGVEKLYDHVLSQKQNAIIDGTFVDYEKSSDNIRRSLEKRRDVQIYYIYQDPVVAWDFTKKREEIEGRRVPAEAFIRAFLRSQQNVARAKQAFSDKIQIHLIIKNSLNDDEELKLNVAGVASYIRREYSEDELKQIIV